MPRYSRSRYRRGYSRRRSTYRYRYPYSRRRYRWRRRPVANAGTRSSTVVQIKQSGNLPFTLAVGSTATQIATVSPLIENATAAVTKVPTWFAVDVMQNPLWTTYAGLYDQYKILSVGAKIVGLDTIGNNGAIGACKVVTYWDRSGNSRDFGTQQFPNAANMINMPGARAHTFTNNSQVKLYTSLRPSDLQEKITYTDTDVIAGVWDAANFPVAQNQSMRFTFATSAGNAATGNSSFNPVLYVMVYTPIANATANVIPINMMIDLYCTIQFRNPKYTSQAAAGAKGVDTEIEMREQQLLANNAAVRIDKADALDSADIVDIDGQSVTKVHFEEPMS